MKLPNLGALLTDPAKGRACFCNFFSVVILLSTALLIGRPLVSNKQRISSEWGLTKSMHNKQSSLCKFQCKPPGCEPLPKGIISRTSNIEMQPIWGPRRSPKRKGTAMASKSLLAMAVGIKQKEVVDKIVKKFFSSNFSVMLFHYDGVVDEWRDLQWSDTALHVSAINQTKWWFAKRFLHPDIVAEYNYVFLWDEDLGVEHFHPGRYISIIKREGLEISQPALDAAKSRVHHQITARGRKGDIHRWVEMMAPVFSRAAWSCVWQMIQNDLIHAWGLDTKLGYCVQGDRSKNIGVVDSEYIVHMGIPTLGGFDENKSNTGALGRVSRSEASDLVPSPVSKDRSAVRLRSFTELEIFKRRWQRAVAEDKCWSDPYTQSRKKSSKYKVRAMG